MIYYRVAWKANQFSVWKWKSTKLTSLEALFRFLWIYRAHPQDHLRVFSSSSNEGWDELLRRENNGEVTSSVTAAQFLEERGIRSRDRAEDVSACKEQPTRENQKREAIAIGTASTLHESSIRSPLSGDGSMSMLKKRWGEQEPGASGENIEVTIPERDELAQYGFTADEIVSLLWLRQWYQNGGSDRVEVLRHWEFLKLLVRSGKLDL
jgi:hypothetical protein